jgi:hypothetical protein
MEASRVAHTDPPLFTISDADIVISKSILMRLGFIDSK